MEYIQKALNPNVISGRFIDMPLHDYWCKNCFKMYEVIVPLKKTDEAIKCPDCKKKLKKMITRVYIKVGR